MRTIFHCIVNFIIIFIIAFTCVFFAGNFFGFESRVILSGSMEPVIKTGSLTTVNKNVPYEEIHTGDVIAFKTENDAVVVHRVITKTNAGYETKGDANGNSDGITTTKENYYGKEIISVPCLGYFMAALQTLKGRIVSVGVIILLLLLSYITDEKTEDHKKQRKESRDVG